MKDQENKVMETESVKGAEVDLERVGDKVAGGMMSDVSERRYPSFENLVSKDIASKTAKERCDYSFGINAPDNATLQRGSIDGKFEPFKVAEGEIQYQYTEGIPQ